jgi:hypothetical protein
MGYVLPEIVSVPDLDVDAVLALAVIRNEPGPMPAGVSRATTHDGPLSYPQKHCAPVATLTVTVWPEAGIVAGESVAEYVQPVTEPACVAVKVCPPIVIVPVRADGVGLGSAEYASVAGPVPDVPVISRSHAAAVVADHGHVGPVAISISPTPHAGLAAPW